jgi:hypothetical protein
MTYDEAAQASIIKARREMRRAYSRDYGNESTIPEQEPVQFVDRTPDDEQQAALADDRAVELQMAMERAFFYGFCACLAVVAVVTASLLLIWK